MLWGNSGQLIPRRSVQSTATYADEHTAMQTSAVWAAIRLRSDLISTMPYDAYRYIQIDNEGPPERIVANLSPFMSGPSFMEFLYSTQSSLDMSGNAIGIIQEEDGQGYPSQIELVPTSACDVLIHNRKVSGYRIYGDVYSPDRVWHEKQFTAPGLHVGLSPIAYAAYQVGQYRSVQDFAMQWFTAGQGPRASLKNTQKRISSREATVVKESWRASQEIGEPFVHGNDWEYNLIQAEHASNDWIESQKLSTLEIARFFGVPADLIDAALAGRPNISYANVTQRNLQFLIMNIGPSIVRRETALSELLPRPRFIRFDTDALLRMDPATRAQWIKTRIDSRELCPSEARAMNNRRPFTEEQIKEFEVLGLNKTATGALTGASDIPVPAGTQTEPAEPAEPAPPTN